MALVEQVMHSKYSLKVDISELNLFFHTVNLRCLRIVTLSYQYSVGHY